MRGVDALWTWYDRLYCRFHKLRDLPLPEGPVLRLGLARYRGRPLTLSDGVVVRPGDRIGVLHLHNEAVAALHLPDRPHHAVLTLLERFRATLRILAGEIAAGSLPDLRALTTVTLFFGAMAKAGFDVLPLRPRFLGRVAGSYQRGVLSRHHPLGRRRFNLDRLTEARAVWISRDAFLRVYGPASRSAEIDTRA